VIEKKVIEMNFQSGVLVNPDAEEGRRKKKKKEEEEERKIKRLILTAPSVFPNRRKLCISL